MSKAIEALARDLIKASQAPHVTEMEVDAIIARENADIEALAATSATEPEDIARKLDAAVHVALCIYSDVPDNLIRLICSAASDARKVDFARTA